MKSLRPFGLVATALIVFACGGAGATPAPASSQPASSVPATSAPATAPASTPAETVAPASDVPSEAPSIEPGSSLDPSAGDAGVVGRVTISNDERGHRDGTWDIVGVKDDGFGSGCSYSFEGDEFTAVAWYDDAPDGQIHQMAVTVAADNVPDGDDTTAGIEDGRVYIDFVSESGFGTAYVGEPQDDDRTSVTIGVTRSGDQLTFDFDGLTWDHIPFTGQMICADINS